MNKKLRPPKLGTEGILGILSITTFLVLAVFSFKIAMGFGAMVCLCAATISMVVLLRTKNLYFIPMLTGQLAAVILMSMTAFFDVEEMLGLVLPIVAIMAASFTVMFVFTFQRKLKWRTREMLELAAQPVEDKTNGLTQRPLQAGRIDATPEEIEDYAAFIRRTLIAIPVQEQSRIVFIINIPMSNLLKFSKDYKNRSWVAFSYDGTVTVNILQADYFMYKDMLAFDQLCQSLGDLFISFFDQYRRGEESRIIFQLNALNLNIITEG
jgi:alkylhydroperoxidase/carboxymuconolactone decarboxylase family protein YurZ